MGISLYTTRLILAALGESQFGVYNIVGGVIGMLGFLNAALASATQRFMSYHEGMKDSAKLQSIFNVSFVLHSVLSLIVGVLLVITGIVCFNGVLKIPSSEIYAAKVVFGCMIVSTMFTVMTVPYDAVLNAHENMRYYGIIGVIESLLKLLVAYCVVYYSGSKLELYGILMAIIPLITLTVMRVYCHRKYNECKLSPIKLWNSELMKSLAKFAGWNVMQVAAAMITNGGLSIVINSFFGTVLNAAQGISTQISGQLMSLTNIFNKAVNPIITKTEGSHNRANTISLAVTSSKFTFGITAFLGIPAIIVMSELLNVWLTVVPKYAVFFACSQLIISLCEQTTSGLGVALYAAGDIRGLSKMRALFKIAVLPICFILFKLGFSVIVAYVLLIVLQGIVNGIIITIYYSDILLGYKIKSFIKDLFIPIIITSTITVGLSLIIKSLIPYHPYSFIAVFVIGVVICGISFYAVCLNNREKGVVRGLVLNLIPRRR